MIISILAVVLIAGLIFLYGDWDRDGLRTHEEIFNIGTGFLNSDTDGDGLDDGREVLKTETDPNDLDTDGDGLGDFKEVEEYQTDPCTVDTDNDGLTDGEEILEHKTNPSDVDTDGDGLEDGSEVKRYNTNPNSRNTDKDKWFDNKEVSRGSNPLKIDIPTANAGEVYETEEVHNRVEEGKTIELNGKNSSDPNGLIEKYSWRIVNDPSQGSSLSSKSSPTPTFHPPDHVSSNTQVEVELTVTDNSGLSVKDTTTITVKPFNEPPEIVSRSPHTSTLSVNEPDNQNF